MLVIAGVRRTTEVPGLDLRVQSWEEFGSGSGEACSEMR